MKGEGGAEVSFDAVIDDSFQLIEDMLDCLRRLASQISSFQAVDIQQEDFLWLLVAKGRLDVNIIAALVSPQSLGLSRLSL